MFRIFSEVYREVTIERFLVAAREGNLDVVKRYIAANKNNVVNMNVVDIDGMTALHWAADKGHTAVVRALLAVDGLEVNAADCSGKTALIKAAFNGYIGIVQALVAVESVNINAQDAHGATPLIYAAEGGHRTIAYMLLALKEIDVNIKDNVGYTALVYAVREDFSLIVGALLAIKDIHISCTHTMDDTVLIWAVRNNHTPIVQTLLASGQVDVNATNREECTALICAIRYNYMHLIHALLAVKGIQVNTINHAGCTALMYAVCHNQKDTVKALLTVDGIDVDITNNAGDTALHGAAREGNIDMVMLLLAADADVTVKNKHGKTAEMEAKTDAIRDIIKNDNIEKRWVHLWAKRDRVVKKLSIVEKRKLEEETEKYNQKEQQALDEIQNTADFTFLSMQNDHYFLQDNRHTIQDFTQFKNVIFTFATLLMSYELDDGAHQLIKVAADMGHDIAKHIADHFSDRKISSNKDDDENQIEREGAHTSELGIFSSPRNNSDCLDVEIALVNYSPS